MELKRNFDNNQAIFYAFTDAKLNHYFNVLYKEFKDCCSYVCGCNNKLISYLMIKNLIPKDEPDDPEAEYVTLDQKVIQRDTIVKSANDNDVNLEKSGSR